MKIRMFAALVAPLAMFGQTQEIRQQIREEIRGNTDQRIAHEVGVAIGRAPGGAPGAQPHIQFIAAEGGFRATLNPVKGAPYSSEGTNEFTQTLSDGTRITRKSTTKMARDNEGRTRSEHENTVVGPVAVPGGSLPTVMIHDPVARETIILDQKEKVARRMKLPALTGAGEMKWRTSEGEVRTAKGETKSQSSHTISHSASHSQDGEVHVETDVIIHRPVPGSGTAFNLPVPPPTPAIAIAQWGDAGQKESLGKQTIAGVVCEGTRMTHSIPAGQIGNDRPIQIVTESWYSPELKLTVMSRTQDPLHGESTFRLHSINRGEPAKSLFQVPADYTVKDDGPNVMFQKRIEKK